MAIEKSTPITASAFGAWWLKNISLFKIDETKTNLSVSYLPFNGQYTLNTVPARLTLEVNALKVTDSVFAGVIDSLLAELQRQYGLKNGNPTISSFVVRNLTVAANNTERPVTVFAQLIVNGTNKNLIIGDAFALASTDSTFANVLNNVINELGRQGKAAGKID